MITLKLHQMEKTLQALEVLIGQKIPVKLGFKLGKLIRALQEEKQHLDMEKMRLVEQYAEKDENNKPIVQENGQFVFLGENLINADKEFIELMNLDVELNIQPITLDELENAGVILALEDVLRLEKLIEE